MNSNVIIHLLKNGLQLKRLNYLGAIGCIAVAILLKTALLYTEIPKWVAFIIFACLLIIGFTALATSSLNASLLKSSGKENSVGYSWRYILSTVRFSKSLVLYYYIEIIFDSFLFLLLCLAIFPINVDVIVWWWVGFLLIFMMRYTTFTNGINSVKARKQIDNQDKGKTIKTCLYLLIGIVTFFVLLGDAKFFSLPSSLYLYALTPVVLILICYGPFYPYFKIVSDPNLQEIKIIHRKAGSLLGMMLLISLGYFYFFQWKTGYAIFNEIDEKKIRNVEILISKNKNIINLKNYYNESPLRYSVTKNRVEIAKLLINGGGNINEKDDYGNSLLSYSAMNCNYDFSEFLIKEGIDFKNISKNNMNALFYASSSNCIVLIKYFLNLGMDSALINKNGQNYIQYGISKSKDFEKEYEFLERNNLKF